MTNPTRGDKRLTDTGLRRYRLEPGKASTILQDGGGLRLDLADKNGKRTARAVFRFRLEGTRRDLYLGSWPERSLADLRKLRDKAREHVTKGEDPRTAFKAAKEAEAQAKAAAAARLTVAGAFEKWERLHLNRNLKDPTEPKRVFALDVLPKLGPLPLEELTRRHIAAAVDSVLERGSPRAAQATAGYLRQFCRWCLGRGYLDADPSLAINKAAICKNAPRERVLSDAELRELAERLPAAHLPAWAAPAVWLLLATATRVAELLEAARAEFDLEARTWLIPGERTKNGREHLIDLSDFALARVRELEALSTSTRWLIPGRSLTTKPVDKLALTKLLGDRQRPEGSKPLLNRHTGPELILPGGRWTAHDLRRTAATIMQELGTSPPVIEAALNHLPPKQLVRTYQRYEHRPERRDALARLGEHLEGIATGKTGRVVALRRA